MKKTSILIVALVIVAIAVVVAVAADGNQATAFSGSFSSGCKTCHGTGTSLFPHNVPAHSTIFSTCTNCHTGTPAAAANVTIAKCGACHGGVVAIASKTPHVGQGCTSCHPAPTTTTAPQTTTTTAPATTTTTGGTTTTAPPTTSTTAPATTTTTIPDGEPDFTG